MLGIPSVSRYTFVYALARVMSTLGRLEWSIPFSSWMRFVLPTLATVPARSSLPRAAPAVGV